MAVAFEQAEDPRQILLKLLQGSATFKASDVHLRVGAPPFIRVDGRLAKANLPPLTAQQIELFIQATSGRSLANERVESWEYSFEQVGVARFRGHAFRESGTWALTLRVIAQGVPTFSELRLPPVIKVLSERLPGLVLITGPTGSGKSTTAAAMVRHAASAESLHVVTIEDPIEYRLTDLPSCVTQREVGRDTQSYAEALKAALREDPDLLFVGEIRDRESLEVVLQAAETGHAIVSTFHTGTGLKTIQRMLAMSTAEDQVAMRSRLADALRGVISQRLLPKKGSKGRVLCCEVLINNYAVKECIKDPAKILTIPAVIERSGDQHMQSFDRHLAQLVKEGLVAPDVALGYATAPADFRRALSLQGVDG